MDTSNASFPLEVLPTLFNWECEGNHSMSIVIKPVLETEVFINAEGGVSIMQNTLYGENTIVMFPIEYLETVIDALCALKSDALKSE